MIDLSIVIPSYEASDCLEQCLASIADARQAHPEVSIEVIVVDNGSSEECVALALGSALRPRVIAWLRNRGFAAAVNAGLRRRRGRHALLLNSDVRIDRDLLAQALEILDQEPSVGVLGPALFHPDGRPQRSVHPQPDLATELLPELVLRWLRPAGFALRGRAARERSSGNAGLRDVEAVRGAVFFIHGDTLRDVGLLDEGYFFFLEETDYCARVRAAGRRVVQAPSLRAEHRLGASSKRSAPLATRIEFHRSLYRFHERRLGWAGAGSVRCVRLVRNLMSVATLCVPALFQARAQRRLAQRWGLVLWHLRGRPAEPGLGRAFAGRSRGDPGQTRRPSAGADGTPRP
jgi:GT2 family glycosyltransferase